MQARCKLMQGHSPTLLHGQDGAGAEEGSFTKTCSCPGTVSDLQSTLSVPIPTHACMHRTCTSSPKRVVAHWGRSRGPCAHSDTSLPPAAVAATAAVAVPMLHVRGGDWELLVAADALRHCRQMLREHAALPLRVGHHNRCRWLQTHGAIHHVHHGRAPSPQPSPAPEQSDKKRKMCMACLIQLLLGRLGVHPVRVMLPISSI